MAPHLGGCIVVVVFVVVLIIRVESVVVFTVGVVGGVVDSVKAVVTFVALPSSHESAIKCATSQSIPRRPYSVPYRSVLRTVFYDAGHGTAQVQYKYECIFLFSATPV